MNMDKVIVNMAFIDVFDFLRDNESEKQAIKRGNTYYKDELNLVTSHLENYGGDYWKEQVSEIGKKVFAGCKVMSYEQFKQLERNKILTGEVTEITKEHFNEMMDVLPPLYWCNHHNVEMFCMSEMYSGSYTNQYAYDLVNGKYYTAMVDSLDSGTWIDRLLEK